MTMVDRLQRDVVVNIRPGYSHDVVRFQRLLDGSVYELPLHDAKSKASNLLRRLPHILDPLRRHIGLVSMSLNHGDALRATAHLDRIAYGLLDHILEGSHLSAGSAIDQLSAFLLPVFCACGNSRNPVIEFEASQYDRAYGFLPLEFLPVAPPINASANLQQNMERFLGFRAEIVRMNRGQEASIAIGLDARLAVEIIAHADQSTPGTARQLHFLSQNSNVMEWWPGQQPIVDSFDGTTELAKRILDIKKRYREQVSSFVHFSCHYKQLGDQSETALKFGRCSDGSEFLVRIFDLRAEYERLRPVYEDGYLPAIFFLNACQTVAAIQGGDSLWNFFQRRNALAIIGSETLLPDQLAAEFSISFYTSVSRGNRLGSAVLSARRRLLERFANPVGLFYSIFGNPMLKIDNSAAVG